MKLVDKIIFDRIQFYAYHGVFEEENKLGQKFEVDVELYLDLKKPGLTDNIEDTVNYAKVYQLVEKVVLGRPKKLLESLAETIAEELLSAFSSKGLKEVVIRVRKLQPPIPGHLQSVTVEISRGV